mmetsp:Transcript_55476/g.156134  ORF Transcript_55476/g.156134 Transcript_55476/m.156134 type:complete len:202 (-) Transcript_55476:779-1384(-)
MYPVPLSSKASNADRTLSSWRLMRVASIAAMKGVKCSSLPSTKSKHWKMFCISAEDTPYSVMTLTNCSCVIVPRPLWSKARKACSRSSSSCELRLWVSMIRTARRRCEPCANFLKFLRTSSMPPEDAAKLTLAPRIHAWFRASDAHIRLFTSFCSSRYTKSCAFSERRNHRQSLLNAPQTIAFAVLWLFEPWKGGLPTRSM